ncbi:MAG: hypothetical protein O3B01_18590 [Planctomycetota bacterium]|nr:hypothetical protein [Planctomycetota bacterium]MDA1140581.1 hypothetical protein [Planctomycetota bacterium]
MSVPNEKFIVDAQGKRTGVILDVDQYQRLLEDLEELESIRVYDAAKASGEEAIPFDDAMREIEAARK